MIYINMLVFFQIPVLYQLTNIFSMPSITIQEVIQLSCLYIFIIIILIGDSVSNKIDEFVWYVLKMYLHYN